MTWEPDDPTPDRICLVLAGAIFVAAFIAGFLSHCNGG